MLNGVLIRPLGDKALRVEIGDAIDEATLARVQAACVALDAASQGDTSAPAPAEPQAREPLLPAGVP